MQHLSNLEYMNMNEYQIKQQKRAARQRAEIEPIAAALGWELDPGDPDACPPPRSYWIKGPDGMEIRASIVWNKTDRWEFSASAWPTYTDRKGDVKRVHPGDMGNRWNGNELVPRETTPTTTAARTRDPVAVAKQIEARVIPEYKRIRAALAEMAASRQEYYDGEAATIDRLFEATQEERRGPGDVPRCIRNMPGDSVRIEYRSSGSVQIGLSGSDACAVIEFLRARRAQEVTA